VTVGPVAGLHVRRAESMRERLLGLIGHASLDANDALLLEPCDAIHTCAMRFAIDVAFLDRSGRVIRVVERLAPWRIAWTPGARAVLETAAGTTRRLGIVPGNTLRLP